MVSLCAATLPPAPRPDVPLVVAQLQDPVPLRLGDERASRDAGRSDLTLEAEAAAAEVRAQAARVAEQQRVREEAARAEAARVEAARVEAARAAADPPGGTPEQNRDLGRSMTLDYGWDEGQFDCLDRIWSQESNWETTAENPSSGAYGIPQSLPASKMASAGDDWSTNPATQIEWGLGYIDDVYGTPCSAWDFKQSTGWY